MAGRAPDRATVVAERILADAGISVLPVSLSKVAERARINIVPKPASAGVSGMLIRLGNDFTIAYATQLQNEGFQRFSIAHEFGHYYLPEHIDHVLAERDVHESRAGYISRDKFELEADRFASALLMPRGLFVKAIGRAGDGLEAIERLARQCNTSLTATAIRYAECAQDEAVAIIQSKDGAIEFSATSEAFRRLRNVDSLTKGERIPRRTATSQLWNNPSFILHAEREEGSPHLHDWFGSGPDVKLAEQAIGLGSYGRVLTVLTVASDFDEEAEEEDEELVRSWTPVFRKSR